MVENTQKNPAKMFREEKQQVKGTKVDVTDVGRNTTIVGIPNAQSWVENVKNATRKTTLQKYVRRSESTVSTLTLGPKMALLVEVQTGTPTSMRLGSASTQ